MRHAVAIYLRLVTVLMAGGAGVESAMVSAAGGGSSGPYRRIGAAVAAAQVRNQPPWAQLAPLGERVGVKELIELGSTLALAGGGSQVRRTLATRANAIRDADIAEVERRANTRSETLALPVVLMFSGFLLLIGYPAVAGLASR